MADTIRVLLVSTGAVVVVGYGDKLGEVNLVLAIEPNGT